MIQGIIMPHPPIARASVGRGEEKKIQATLDAYHTASQRIADYAPETIVIISPHNIFFSDAFYVSPGKTYEDSLARFRAPDDRLSIPYDEELRTEIVRLMQERGIPVVQKKAYANEPDHGSLIPLLFVSEVYTGFRVVRIAPSMLSDDILKETGSLIERAAAHLKRKITVIASGDLSHKLLPEGPYGFVEEGPEFESRVTEMMRKGKLKGFCEFTSAFRDKCAECGLPGFIMLSGALGNYHIKPDLLSYEGTFGVGYAICTFEAEDVCVRLAKDSLTKYILSRKMIPIPKGLPEWMTELQAGAFVSLHKKGELRGCIGTILSMTACVAQEIISMAVEAGTHDPRFQPVRADELADLEYNVDVLSEPEKTDIAGLDAKRYGVIVTNGNRRGLLLPDLEGVDTIEQQISIALQKAGIDPDEGYSLERFQVERHT
ncbi:MAG: AmmeMemoRadiSam system protein A [Anaerolineaceae bacterium]|nr:AmmeMemoRadiSam system protein A [Anaerolineaceae bacterium]